MAKGTAEGGAACTAISRGRKEPIENTHVGPYSEILLGARWKLCPTGESS